MIVNCIKKTLAGILALSLIAGSVSIQTFADEIEQYVPQWIITTSEMMSSIHPKMYW